MAMPIDADLSNLVELRRFEITDVDNVDSLVPLATRIMDSKDGSKEYPQALIVLALAAKQRYLASRNWRELEEAIRLTRLALQSDCADRRADIQYELAGLLDHKYRNTKDLEDLRTAVGAHKQSVLALPERHEHRGPRLHHYLRVLRDVSVALHDVSELNDILGQIDDLFDFPVNHLDFWTRTNRQLVTECLSRRYEITGLPLHFCNLILHAIQWWNGSGNPASPTLGEPTLEESRSLPTLLEKVSRLAIAPQEDSIVIQISNAFHREYLSRVQRLGPRRCIAEIAREVKINVEIVTIISFDPAQNEAYQKECMDRFLFAKSIGAYTCQIRTKAPWLQVVDSDEQLEEARAVAPDKIVLTRKQIAELAESSQSNELDDSESDPGDPKRRECPNPEFFEERRNVVKKFLEQSERFRNAYVQGGSLNDLQEAIELATQAVDKSDSDEFDAVDPLFKAPTPSGRHISEVEYDIVLHSQARLVKAICLKALYQRNGSSDHLNNALDEIQQAYGTATRIPYGQHPDLALIASRLGLLLRLRFLKFGQLSDLNLAAKKMRTVIDNGFGHSHEQLDPTVKIELLVNYALILKTRFKRTRQRGDIDECIDICRRGLAMMGPEAALYASAVSSLAVALEARFQITQDLADFDAAITSAKEVIPVLLACPAANIAALGDSSSLLLRGLKHEHRLNTISESEFDDELSLALRCGEQTLQHIQEQHVFRGSALLNLGSILEMQYHRSPSDTLYQRCLETLQAAWASVFQDMSQKLGAGRRAARFLCAGDRWAEAAGILEDMIQLLSSAAPRWLPSEDRLGFISQFSGLASDAAMTRLLSSPPTESTRYEALRSLELGRGIILGSTLDYRQGYQRLISVSPELAEDFVKLTGELDAISRFDASSKIDAQRQKLTARLDNIMKAIREILGIKDLTSPIPPGSLESYKLHGAAPEVYREYHSVQRELDVLPKESHSNDLTGKRQRLVSDFDSLLARIRSHDELQDFLLPLSLESTKQMARGASIVVVFASKLTDSGAAFIINRRGLSMIELPHLTSDDVEDWMEYSRSATDAWTLRTAAGNNKKMRGFLQWLWLAAVQPIINELEESKGPEDTKPRVHWIGAGLLSGAPFHAAGDSSTEGNECAMDRVISSYTQTLRALAYTQEAEQSPSRVDRMLLVSAPEAPGARSLPLIHQEVANIQRLVSEDTQTVLLNNGTPKQVLSELPLATRVHFACHGYSDAKDIENSHLALHYDANTEIDSGSRGKLSVRQIQTFKSPTARLAYLSACSGAENKSTLADETTHLAGAFQLAGFEHVIGTLWQTKDAACQQVAEDFYKHLCHEKGGAEVKLEEHLALHRAVQTLREGNRDKPLIWAPFVHFGS